MMQVQGNKQVNRLALFFAATYMISYITRINYGAIIAEMEKDTLISKSLLSMAPTGSFITYGLGQIISGICGDRLSPKKLITCGLITTVLMNLLIPLCQSPYQMLAVWCVNGFAQAFMWPPLVRIMTGLLSEEDYKKAMVKVTWGSSCGTIAIYLTAPLIISIFSCRWVFLFSALSGLIMIFVWNRYAQDVRTEWKKVKQEVKGPKHSLFTPLMLSIMVAIILQGMLRDGVTTWMPTYISETYHLSSSVSILTGVLLPVFGIICLQLTSLVYRKKFTNPLLCAGIFFGAGAVSALALVILTGQNAVFSVLFSALLTGCMHGVNLILICMLPSFFKEGGNVSTVSGVLNSCTYVGSALSTYGIALLSENYGWGFTLTTWLVIGALGFVICMLCAKPWGKKFSS